MGPDVVVSGPVLNGHGEYLLGGHLTSLVSAAESAPSVGPSPATYGVIDKPVLVGPVLTVTGSVPISTYPTSTLAINILANLVCSIVAVTP